MDPENIRETYFALGWTSHGGQGLGWQPSEIDNIPLGDIDWYVERINRQRSAEAKQIKAARG